MTQFYNNNNQTKQNKTKSKKHMQIGSAQYFLSLIQCHSHQLIQRPAQIKISDLRHLIHSKHQNLHQIFQVLRMHKYYFIVVRQLLVQIINDVYMQIDQKLEIHIIRCIWKQFILQLLIEPLSRKASDKHQKVIGSDPDLYQKIILFLCQKMRSLKFNIRLEALNSFLSLVRSVIQNQKGMMAQALSFPNSYQFHKILIPTLNQMIEKQQLIKQVSYGRGIVLLLLEDEYHQVRKQTLALLRQVLIHTLYLGSERAKSIIKQTILYMLNDQHQLVRQESLLDIRQISLIQINFQNPQKQRIFGQLNAEQINTVLMCLKQNRDRLRQECYQCLKWVGFLQIKQIMTVLQKLFQTLLIYKQDKPKIYSLLLHYSYYFKQQMIQQISQKPTFLKTIYEFNKQEEPNPKNIIYKGKLILMSEWYEEISQKLPFYFKRHLNYVRDLEIYKLSNKVPFQKSDVDSSQKGMLSVQCQQHLYNTSPQELNSIIQMEESVSSGVKKQLFKMFKNLLMIYTLLQNNKNQLYEEFQLQNFQMLTTSEQSYENIRKNQIRKTLTQNWKKLSQISYTFSIKNNPILLDIISKIGHIWQNIFQDQDIDEVFSAENQKQMKNKMQEPEQKIEIQEEQKRKFFHFYHYVNYLVKLTLQDSFQKVKPYTHKIKTSNSSNQKLIICLESPAAYYENYWIKVKPQEPLLKIAEKQYQWLYIPLLGLKCLTNLAERPLPFLQEMQNTQIFQLQLKLNSKYNTSFQLSKIEVKNQYSRGKSKFLKQILTPIKYTQAQLIVIIEREEFKLSEWKSTN